MTAAAADPGRRERRLSLAFSFALHGLLLAVIAGGWLHLAPRHPAPRQLAIEAVVLQQAAATPAPAPSAAPAAAAQPAPVNPAPPPPPQPTEAQRQEQAAAARRDQQQAAAARAREQQAHERELAAEREHAAEQRAAAERAAQEKAAQERAAQQRAAEEKAAQEKAAQDKAAAERAKREAADRARREAELRAQVAAEERVNAARSSAAMASWQLAIRNKVQGAWIRPAGARPGVSCDVTVTQVPGGEVTSVRIGSCNGDAAVRESIEAAVYRASPLPSPSNPDLFDRTLGFTFHPDD